MTISNQPPPYEAFSLHIEELFALIADTTAGAKVTTDDQETALDSLLDDVRTARKDADKERAAEKKPHDDAGKAVQAKWEPLLDRCDMAADEIKQLLTPYRTAKQAAKDEAARKAREEADERQRRAQEALRSSEDMHERFDAEQELKVAAKLVATANKIDRSATGLRTRYVATLVDPTSALKHYRERQPELLKAWLLEQAQRDTNAGARMIPGFEIAPERKAA